ncbi:hypothetical protein ACOSP7_004814 [Xanthoceras sorbifolium]
MASHFSLLLTIFMSLIIPFGSSLSFNYTSFSPRHDDNITYERAFPDPNRIIQLAKENGMVGRATYNKPIRLWDRATRNLTDFSTHFIFVIDSQNRSSYGDGLAFFLAPQGSMIPTVTKGGSFGLTNDDEPLNSTSNPFVAVEFDIYPNPWDPPMEHVGIDISSMRSVSYLRWWSDIMDGQRSEAWISYTSSTHNLSVVFTGIRDNVTVMQHLDYKVDLRLYLPEFVTIGFSAATGNATAIHSLYSWEFSSNLEVKVDSNDQAPPPSNPPPPSNRRRRRGSRYEKTTLEMGLGVGGGVLVSLLVLVWFLRFGRGSNGRDEEDNNGLDEEMDDEFERGTGPKKFSYKELARATDNFREEDKLGEGGFGGVYKGFLRDLNCYVAVKRVSKGSKQGIKEYSSEVKIISKLKHRNLVQLMGWCHEKRELLLVYEFMPNGSLDSYLFKENSLLTWELRYKIAQDLASGLLYLHEEWEQCVVHRDIKSSNIMLDENFNAKLGDFGLARLVDHAKGSQTTVLAGTMGYMAPECATTGRASKESDVYSFGIVALEVACGRKPINPKAEDSQVYMVQWVWELYGSGKSADPRLCKAFDEQQMEYLMIVGLWCAHPDENLRPSIRQPIQVLNFEDPLPVLPPKMPVPIYLTPSANNPISIQPLSYGSGTYSDGSHNQSSS